MYFCKAEFFTQKMLLGCNNRLLFLGDSLFDIWTNVIDPLQSKQFQNSISLFPFESSLHFVWYMYDYLRNIVILSVEKCHFPD